MRKAALRVAMTLVVAIATLPFAEHPSAAADCGQAGQPTRTVYLPNITKTLGGAGGWYTPFIVENVGVAATDLEISFYRFSDGALVRCRRVPGLSPYRSFADVPNNDTDLPGDSQFAVVVRSFGSEVVAVVNEHQGAGATAEALSYVGLSAGALSENLPYVAKLASGWLTTFVVQNLGTATATVTARFTSLSGTRTATLTRTISPGASRFVNPIAEPTLESGVEYSVVLTADQPIAAIANAHNDAFGTSAPMGFSYNAVPSAAPDSTFVPSVMRNADGGRTTRLVIQNTAVASATPTLLFRRAGAPSASLTAPTAIAPGRAWSFDVRTRADGATPCPAAGATTCIGEGDWSLVVGGGQFAVLAITTTATSALGYIGAGALGNRAYLPNVTRTLGGPSGWTTPIVLQSAGATSATLRWYRFADGTLVARQLVTGLSDGVAVRVDPRSVTSLSDDTQYAVVVDAQGGNIAATVLELSFAGGDGAMAYEGFKATVSATPEPTMLSLTTSKASVFTGARVQLTATVKDQFDNIVSAPVSWSASPATLGTVSTTGLFASSDATGVATITASVGSLSTAARVTVAERPKVTIGGLTYQLDAGGPADVYTELTISGADASMVADEVAKDVPAIEADYGRGYATRPQLFLTGSSATFSSAMQSILHFDAAFAQQLSVTAAGIYDPGEDAVMIDWSKERGVSPFSSPRHELTHMMEHEIASPSGIPAWLNEGSARLEELTVPGSDYFAMEDRYGAASMAATGTLFSLNDLASQFVWDSRADLGGIYQYYEAAEAVRLLRERVGIPGVVRVLRDLSAGATLDQAYVDVTGEPLSVFAAALPARLRASAPAYPGIATAQDAVTGPGLAIMFYGFPPGSLVSYTVTGGSGHSVNTAIASRFGTIVTFLGKDWAPGTYSISASWSGGTVSTTGVKPAATSVSFVP